LRKDVITTTFLAALGRVPGLLVPFVIAATLGTSRVTDAFFLSYGFILFATLLIGNLFETLIVPYVTEARKNNVDIGRVVGAIIARSTVILALLLVPVTFAVGPVLALVAGPQSELGGLVRVLVMEMAPIVLLQAWTSAFHGAMNANRIFHVAALSPLLRSFIVMVTIYAASSKWGVHSVALGFTLGEGLRCFVSWYLFEKRVARLRLTWEMLDEVAGFFTSAVFQSLGSAFHNLVPLVSQLMAAPLSPGSISIYTYVLRLRSVPLLVFSSGVAPVVFSHWADQYSSPAGELTWSSVSRSLVAVSSAVALGAAALLPLCPSIAQVALGWGAFPNEKLTTVSTLLRLFLISLPFDVAALLCVRVLLLLRGHATFMSATLCRLLVLVALNALLIPRYGLIGIGIGTVSVNVLLSVVVMGSARRLCKREKSFHPANSTTIGMCRQGAP